MSSTGERLGNDLGGLIGYGIGGIFAGVGAAMGGAVIGVANHLQTPRTPRSEPRDASPPSTKKQTPRPAIGHFDSAERSNIPVVAHSCSAPVVAHSFSARPVAPVFNPSWPLPVQPAQEGAVTAPQLQAARSLHAVQVQGINYFLGCKPGKEKCRSLIDTVAPGTPVSNPFFPDAKLQIVHPDKKFEAKGRDIENIFPQALSQMEVVLEGMESRMLRDELGPCIDMAVVGRYSQNGSAPRPVYVMSRCREDIASGGLRTAQMRWVFQGAPHEPEAAESEEDL